MDGIGDLKWRTNNMKRIHVCHFAEPPTAKHECREAIWSQGRACRNCKVSCYRSGWCKRAVDADNKKLVVENRNAK